MEFRLDVRAEDFDYFDTALTDALDFQLGDQLARARVLLANRSREEIEYGIDSLDWLLAEGGRRFRAEILEGEHGETVWMNRSKALKGLVPVFDLGDQEGFPQATWAEYFALLALACVGEELYYEGRSWAEIYGPALAAQIDPDEAQRRRDWQRWGSAMEALEAVCYAEHFQAIDAAKEAQRERGRQGKKATMRPYDEVRQKLLAHYDAHLSGRTDRGAAKRLYQHFQDEVDEVLKTDDPEHQIAKWVGLHRRRKASS